MQSARKNKNYLAPFQHSKYNKVNNRIDKNNLPPTPSRQFDSKERPVGQGYEGGVFHLFFSREKARKVLKWMKQGRNYNYSIDGFLYKIIKVKFMVKDFVVVGHASKYFKQEWKLGGNPDNICVTAFKFV